MNNNFYYLSIITDRNENFYFMSIITERKRLKFLLFINYYGKEMIILIIYQLPQIEYTNIYYLSIITERMIILIIYQ